MGIEPFLVTSTLNGVMAQRLVRTICSQCKRPSHRQDEAKRFADHLGAGWGKGTVYEGAGCKACGGTGYSGRTAIFELLEMGDALRAAVLERSDLANLQKIAAQAGLRSLRHDGLAKVMAGLTTVEEVLRVTQEH
jgi:general secretion pathway protein E